MIPTFRRTFSGMVMVKSVAKQRRGCVIPTLRRMYFLIHGVGRAIYLMPASVTFRDRSNDRLT